MLVLQLLAFFAVATTALLNRLLLTLVVVGRAIHRSRLAAFSALRRSRQSRILASCMPLRLMVPVLVGEAGGLGVLELQVDQE